mgnify:FL=1
MKTAICLSGTGRSIKYTIENLTDNVLTCFNNCDIILYLTESDIVDSVLKHFSHIDNIYVHIEKEDPIDISNMQFFSNWPPSIPNNLQKGRQIFVQMLKSRLKLRDLMLNQGSYDRVVFSRIDVVYQEPLSISIGSLDLDDDTIYVPNFHNWLGGINDRFAVSTQAGMSKYLSLYENLSLYVNQGHLLQAENTLKHHLAHEGLDVKHHNVRFSRIRNGKQHDSFNEA